MLMHLSIFDPNYAALIYFTQFVRSDLAKGLLIDSETELDNWYNCVRKDLI